MGKYKIIIAPSSDDEREVAEIAHTYKEAQELMRKGEHTMFEFTYDTFAELRAFIRGYETGIGYTGEGFWITNQ